MWRPIATLFGADYNNPLTIVGTPWDDELTGSSVEDVINSGNGNDIIYSNGGPDQIVSSYGEDTIIVPDFDFRGINGGHGFDKLQWEGTGESINLSQYSSRISSIENLEIGGNGANTIQLNLLDVINIAGDGLYISGDSDDQVIITQLLATLLGRSHQERQPTLKGIYTSATLWGIKQSMWKMSSKPVYNNSPSLRKALFCAF